MSKQNKSKPFYVWLCAWIGFCAILFVLGGGINCQCPPPEEEYVSEITPDSGTIADVECSCVEPGSVCKYDDECRNQIRYCIPLRCIDGICKEKKDWPDTNPQSDANPNHTDTDAIDQ